MKHKVKFSRRSAIRTIGSIGAGCAMGNTLFPERAEAAGKHTTAFALVGDRWHSFDYIRTAMTRTFVNESGISIDFTSDTTLLTKKILKNYRLLIILLKEGGVFFQPKRRHGRRKTEATG